jgi:hypothetical protein
MPVHRKHRSWDCVGESDHPTALGQHGKEKNVGGIFLRAQETLAPAMTGVSDVESGGCNKTTSVLGCLPKDWIRIWGSDPAGYSACYCSQIADCKSHNG